jgi:hypothetical protein
MDNFDLKKYLVENKVTRNSRMMKEAEETQDLAQAFAQAGIDMNAPVKVVEAGGGPGGSIGEPKTMDAKAVLRMLKAEKASFERDSDEGEDVYYDFEAGQSYPGAKLAIMFGDQYEYIIHQSGIGEARKPKHSRMMKEAEKVEASPEAIKTYLTLLKDKFGHKLGQFIEDELYDSMNMGNYTLPEEWNDEEFSKWAKMDLEWNASEGGEEVIDSNFAEDLFKSNLKLYGVEDYL